MYWAVGRSGLVSFRTFHVQLVTVATSTQVTKTTARSNALLRRHPLHCAIISMEHTPFVPVCFEHVPRWRSRITSTCARARVHPPLPFHLFHQQNVDRVDACRPRHRRTSRSAAATRPPPPFGATTNESIFSRGAFARRTRKNGLARVDDGDAHPKLLGREVEDKHEHVFQHANARARQQEGRLRVRVRRGVGMDRPRDVQGASPPHVDGAKRTNGSKE